MFSSHNAPSSEHPPVAAVPSSEVDLVSDALGPGMAVFRKRRSRLWRYLGIFTLSCAGIFVLLTVVAMASAAFLPESSYGGY